MNSADDLHPYDGVERRFRHTDEDPTARARGRELVARLLHLPEPPPELGLRYDLSFHSGGMGVFDRLYMELPGDRQPARAIAERMELVSPGAARADPEWGDGFEWLVCGDDEPEQSLDEAVRVFIEEERSERVSSPSPGADVWFQRCSDVNSWLVLYECDTGLCVVAYDQG